MARYSHFKYGDGTEYGSNPANANLMWTFIVDWDGDGYFSGDNEAIYMVDLKMQRGRDFLVRPGGSNFERYRIGEAYVTLYNDGRYDPYNTGSPLYPDVTPGKYARLQVKDTNTGTDYGIMRGVVDDIQPFSKGRDQFVRIRIKDGLRWLRDKTITTTLSVDAEFSAIIDAILAAADWPSEWPTNTATSALMSTVWDWWWAWEQNALQALEKLLDAEVGVCFHDRDGVFQFYNRDFTHNRTLAVTQSEILTEIVLPQPWETIRNEIRVGAQPKEAYTGAILDLYSMLDAVALANGETFQIDAEISSQLFRGEIVPDPATVSVAHEVWTEATGTGIELTDDCPLTYQSPISRGTRVTVVNNSGSDGWITYVWIGGKPVHAPYHSTRFALDATSQAAYGARTLTLDSFWQGSNTTAQEIADWLLAELKDPTLQPVIQFEARPSYQFYLDLYDRVELSIAAKDISANFRVGSIEHEWLVENGQAVRTTMKLEPYFTPFS